MKYLYLIEDECVLYYGGRGVYSSIKEAFEQIKKSKSFSELEMVSKDKNFNITFMKPTYSNICKEIKTSNDKCVAIVQNNSHNSELLIRKIKLNDEIM